MEVLKNNHLVEAQAINEPSEPTALNGYGSVRFNALKHGILSQHVVLGHEDKNEFDNLLSALIIEYQPGGPTEMHLVEELAGIMWRKKRVLLAEGAAINRGLRSVAHSAHDSPVPAAAPFERAFTVRDADLPDLLTETPDETAKSQQNTKADLAATRKAAAILRKGGANAYQRARRTLIQESRDWWDQYVEDGEHPATADGLEQFISETLEPICFQMEREARYQPAIKAQTLGEGVQVHRFEKLNRYETHLDRKFERTLAMLLKLKELRGGGSK
ncbi:hypothetical protein [Candidatus Methylospira mobilis]|uniref:hypothetical protein n=1 Tax=Candidatus Methylospira mobilis TaxID=1808979 RepID=UPI0018852BBD|nr:hypothetical protein [Candidatus Methylospira mobilis]